MILHTSGNPNISYTLQDKSNRRVACDHFVWDAQQRGTQPLG